MRNLIKERGGTAVGIVVIVGAVAWLALAVDVVFMVAFWLVIAVVGFFELGMLDNLLPKEMPLRQSNAVYAESNIWFVGQAVVIWLSLTARGIICLLVVLVFVWVVDAASMVIGRKFGRKDPEHPLFASSPNKTRAGVAAGIVAGILLGLLAGYIVSLMEGEITLEVLLLPLFGALLAVVGMCGDLLESKCKRLAGIKNSGDTLRDAGYAPVRAIERFLGNHGGVLDRFDSFWPTLILFMVVGKIFHFI
ncbi:MAG: phosphatidate cytidylyltransferase [Candidatus Nomurabacteria bacterium]|nr:phosphatidate cytidylyltransferase [Candidatus Nomurabacteria bacterium]